MLERRRKQRGSILAATMIIALLAMILAVGLAEYSTFQFRTATRYELYKNEFAIAEAVFAKAFAEIRFLVESIGPNIDSELASITPPSFARYNVRSFQITKGSEGIQTVTDGPWKGIELYSIKYRVMTRVHQRGNTAVRFRHPGVRLSQDLELRYVPLHMFGVFYDTELEMHPEAAMAFNGRVHSNGNVYLGAAAALSLQSYVSSIGQILHGTDPASGKIVGAGDVTLWDGAANVSMQVAAGVWLDHNHPNWATDAATRWKGHVNDEAYNVNRMPLSIPGGEFPHAIIDRADPSNDPPSLLNEKFEYKAGLKILRNPGTGVVEGLLQDGTPVPLTYPDPLNPTESKCVYSEGSFYDQRETTPVATIDISIANLNESGIAPQNGILYVSNEGANGAVRITNGAELPLNPAGGFSIATDDAIYIQGDYNTINKKPALIAADAVTVLSNIWDDAKSTSNDMAVRKANATTVNGVFFQGIVPTQIDPADGITPRYSGGVENFFRFLENWNGVNFQFSGSLISLWLSQKWTGWWRDWPVSRPPNRVWSWDASLATVDGPPGTPRVFEVVRRNWNATAGI